MLTAYPIRKIVVGDPKGGISYSVGQSFGPKTNHYPSGEYKITRIIRHENNYHLLGCLTYIVYGTYKNGDERPFKYFENQQVAIECDMEKSMLGSSVNNSEVLHNGL